MTAPKTVLVGDRVRYESAAGIIRGEVVSIDEALNAAGNVIPWITVQYIRNNKPQRVRLADTALSMMKFKVLFRD
jgi:hypothetical protein